jgi:hypothetical protein
MFLFMKLMSMLFLIINVTISNLVNVADDQGWKKDLRQWRSHCVHRCDNVSVHEILKKIRIFEVCCHCLFLTPNSNQFKLLSCILMSFIDFHRCTITLNSMSDEHGPLGQVFVLQVIFWSSKFSSGSESGCLKARMKKGTKYTHVSHFSFFLF